MTPTDRAAMEAQAAQHEAARDAALAEANQHHGAALALRAWLAAHPPVEAPPAKEPPGELPTL